jgi:hypothetical protein
LDQEEPLLSASLELEIKHLLAQEESLEKVIDQVVQTVENDSEGMSYDQVVTLCRFLWKAKAYNVLTNFVQKHWNSVDFKIPWAHFLESLNSKMNSDLAEALWEGIAKTKSVNEACLSSTLDPYIMDLGEARKDLRREKMKKAEDLKEELLMQLQTFRVQHMSEQEKKLLQKMMRIFPDDLAIRRQSSDFRDRSALDIISRRSPLRRASILEKEPVDPKMEKAKEAWGQTFLDQAAKQPEFAYEYAVATFMMGLFEASLKIIAYAEESVPRTWLHLELLLKNHRYVDLLQELAQVEVKLAHDSETFFATAYYRAQAFWGLGQKHLAVEVMEGLLAARPHYRMGTTLLNQWRTQ